MKLIHLESLEDFRPFAPLWDDLWLRSDATLPTMRAAPMIQWLNQFAAKDSFHCLLIEDEDGQLVAGLPLVGGILRGISCGKLPRNCWSDCGDLLVDTANCSSEHIDLLIHGMRSLPWTILAGEFTDLGNPAWKILLAGLKKNGNAFGYREQFHVGNIDISGGEFGGDWEKYQQAWSSNHRRAIRKSLKRLQKTGNVTLDRRTDISFEEAAELVQCIAEIEDKSWKGDVGTSILQTEGMLEYFTQQAQLLAESGELEILFLKTDGRVIATDYAYNAKRILHSHKIAYDPEFADVGPGRMLVKYQLEEYFRTCEYDKIDTLGILSDSNGKWATSNYTVSRFMLSTGGLLGNTAVFGYEKVWPTACRWVGKRHEDVEPAKLGAAEYLAS